MQKPCVWFWICAGGSEQGGELMDFGLCYCAQKSKRLNFPQETVAKTTLLWGCLNCFPCSNDGRAETSISGPAVPWVSPLRFPFSRYCLSAPSEAVIMTKLPSYSMPFFFLSEVSYFSYHLKNTAAGGTLLFLPGRIPAFVTAGVSGGQFIWPLPLWDISFPGAVCFSPSTAFNVS